MYFEVIRKRSETLKQGWIHSFCFLIFKFEFIDLIQNQIKTKLNSNSLTLDKTKFNFKFIDLERLNSNSLTLKKT